MSSHEVIALVTDALRGQLQSVLPPGAAVSVGVPSPDGPAVPGLFVHPLRIAHSKARRSQGPARYPDGNLMPPSLHVELDYLIAGPGGDALAELALLDAALQLFNDYPVQKHEALGERLSQPERWASFASGSLTIRWLLLDLTLEQVSGVWVACGMRQRAGIFVRGEVAWQADGDSQPPTVEIDFGRVTSGVVVRGVVPSGQ